MFVVLEQIKNQCFIEIRTNTFNPLQGGEKQRFENCVGDWKIRFITLKLFHLLEK